MPLTEEPPVAAPMLGVIDDICFASKAEREAFLEHLNNEGIGWQWRRGQIIVSAWSSKSGSIEVRSVDAAC